jgi:hypothetical protein
MVPHFDALKRRRSHEVPPCPRCHRSRPAWKPRQELLQAATKQRGKPRAAASVSQLRGIVRAAFAWWQQDERTRTPTSFRVLR